jgi:hypothetical protein
MQLLRHVPKRVATSDPVLVVLLVCIELHDSHHYRHFTCRPTYLYVMGLSADNLNVLLFRREVCKIGYLAIYEMNA